MTQVSFFNFDFRILGGQEQAVFFIAATLFAIMVVITINQVEEKPPADNAEGGGDPASLHHYLMSIVYMPRRLRWLCLHMMLSWLSVLCFSLFFTDFVGQVLCSIVFLYPKNTNDHKRSRCASNLIVKKSFFKDFLTV